MPPKRYLVEQYSRDALTVLVDQAVPNHLQSVFDFRRLIDGRYFFLTASIFEPELLKLFQLGFDYVDVGKHCEWIAAEIAFTRKPSAETIENGAAVLLMIQEKIKKLK